MNMAASFGADVIAGSFETVGSTQVARLALAVPRERLAEAQRALSEHGIDQEVRA